MDDRSSLLSGKRIDETGVMQLLNDPESMILIAQSDETILAIIHAHRKKELRVITHKKYMKNLSEMTFF